MLSDKTGKLKIQLIDNERVRNACATMFKVLLQQILALLTLDEAETLFERLQPLFRNAKLLNVVLERAPPAIISLCLRYLGKNSAETMFTGERTSASTSRLVLICIIVLNCFFPGLF